MNSLFLQGLAFLVLVCTFACDLKKDVRVAAKDQTKSVELERTFLRDALLLRKEKTLGWAETCDGVPSKENCDIGDSLLYSGILCLSGQLLGCEAVKRSQGRDGRVWRAPQRVDADGQDSFSRDMALGGLAYLVASKDTYFASRWMSWIRHHNKKLCADASDNRCDFSPGLWNLFKEVWRYIGLQPSDEMYGDIINDEFMLPLQTWVSDTGYPLHLHAVNLLLRSKISQFHYFGDVAARMLVNRQPQNPFFAFVANGKTTEVATRILEQCPVERPAARRQWYIERDTADAEWRHSMGWDCIALINFYLQDERSSN